MEGKLIKERRVKEKKSKLNSLFMQGLPDRDEKEKIGYGLPLAVPTMARDQEDKPMIVYSYFDESSPKVIFYDLEKGKDIVVTDSAHMFIGFLPQDSGQEIGRKALFYVDFLLAIDEENLNKEDIEETLVTKAQKISGLYETVPSLIVKDINFEAARGGKDINKIYDDLDTLKRDTVKFKRLPVSQAEKEKLSNDNWFKVQEQPAQDLNKFLTTGTI